MADQAISVLETVEPIQFGPEDDGRLVSAREFATAHHAEPWRYERHGGRLQVMSPDSWEHASVSEPWRDRLGAYALARPDLVRRVISQAWVRVDPNNDRIADIGIYLVGQLDDLKIPHLVPDLIFEFVSPSKADRHRDYILKRAEYQRVGVREYVIVDRFDRKVTVLTLQDGVYVERVIPVDGVYESPLLPDLVIELIRIWPA